jgi:antiviral helicase SKI2
MLPEHISVILLSATVPNAMEFADWIGCTKKRLIHVVSTIKRPVPLEHFLYTGFSPKTADQLFKIVNQEGRFVTEGYKQALKAKELHGSKRSFSKSANHERNIWMSLISMLQKQNKLPLVSFTFSRKRCDSNASSLTTLDLTDSAEKNYIHSFFMKCISKLKGSDQTLPQVVNMKELLKRGIAVHHSGILPLLKEIIELLFQKGYVRLLFATETFAMGVNMPARSVVFDSIEKHDGKRKRDLLSSEYIQMAGRAGRRGLDLTGTVIILCKDYEIPESSELHRMILGKPIRLESKFYVTYSMILSLAKVDTLRIEDMLKKSYSEIDSTREVPLKRKELQKVISELSLVREHTTCPPEVDRFYAMCERLKDISMEISHGLFDHPAQRRKVASPGRLLLLATSNGLWEVAILLKIDTAKGTRVLTAMVPCEMGKERLEIDGYQCLQPPDVSTINIWAGPVTIHSPLDWSYSIANVPEECIMGIVDKDFNVEPNKILDDFKKRQIPRFRQNSPSPHCQNVLLQLQSFLTSFPPLLNPVKDLRIHEFDFVHKIKEAEYLREQLREVASKLLKMGSRKDTIVVNPLFMEQVSMG